MKKGKTPASVAASQKKMQGHAKTIRAHAKSRGKRNQAKRDGR